MRTQNNSLIFSAISLVMVLVSGCCCKEHCAEIGPYHPGGLGTISDSIWQAQETNAEASDFVIYEHEFIGNSSRLNTAGEEHVKQIAVRAAETPFPVLIEPSSMSTRADDEYGYPVHNNPELDLERREMIVHALTHMGIPDADRRVVVAPALTPGFEQFEAERAYQQGMWGGGGRGFGAFGFGGGMGLGFGGGIGGGFF